MLFSSFSGIRGLLSLVEENTKNRRKRGKKTILYRRVCFVLAAFLCIFIAAGIVKKDTAYSDAEMRSLQTFPRISLSGILSGETGADIASYFSDQFAGRNFFVGIRTGVTQALGQSVTDGVFKGDGGYLFKAFPAVDAAGNERLLNDIKMFSDKYPEVSQYMLLEPSASEILPGKVPAGAPVGSGEAYRSETAAALDGSVSFIDVKKELLPHNAEYLYYKTDSRWTSLCAYYAYKASAKTMQLDTSLDTFEAMPVTNDYQGRLQAESGYDSHVYDQINVYFYRDSTFKVVTEYAVEGIKSVSMFDSSALSERDKYSVFFSGNHPLIRIETSSESARRILVLKDSSANCFIPLLTTNFREIVVIDPACFYGSLDAIMTEEKITDVLYLYDTAGFASDTELAPVLENIE